MRLIIGLGNPGQQYKHTRHNIGFNILDTLQKKFSFPDFSFNKKFNSEISEGYFPHSKNNQLILIKPQTFMNLSGSAVRSLLDFYKLNPEDILVIQDDLDIEIGTFKLATDSRSAGHNGIQNIIDQIGTQKFNRLRIGIGKNSIDTDHSCHIGAHDFVLEKFSAEESQKINSILDNIIHTVTRLL